MAKKKTKYKAAKGAQFSQDAAQVIGQHLETLGCHAGVRIGRRLQKTVAAA